jgi:hypothetical protein
MVTSNGRGMPPIGWPGCNRAPGRSASRPCARRPAGEAQYANRVERALAWALAERGQTLPVSSAFGHDSSLAGWPWAAGTHSWLEPTAMFVLALKAVGHLHHARTREAVRLIVDRQLPRGGWNYGNTIVLGQVLLSHLLPTGLAMMALAGEETNDPRTSLSLAYLQHEISETTATASLCMGLMGLQANRIATPKRDAWLSAAYRRVVARGASPYKLALLALASAEKNPLVSMA